MGQRSHRLEVLTPHTHPTSRREGKTPLTQNGQRIAGSPIYVEKGVHPSCHFSELSDVAEFSNGGRFLFHLDVE